MLKSALFSVIFKVDDVEMREEYYLAYRTEEEFTSNFTLFQQAKKSIAKDLDIPIYWVEIIKIMRIHNDLILEE